MNAIHELNEEQSMDMLQAIVSCFVLGRFSRTSENEIAINFSDMGNEGDLPTPSFSFNPSSKTLFVKAK